MPSLLSCFCVHHRRHTFSARKRHSRKKILSQNSDWISDTSSDLYHRSLPEEEVQKSYSPEGTSLGDDKQDSGDILARLLERQSSPRRRHVQDIFREEPPVIEPIPDIHSLHRHLHQTPYSMEKMNGYVPKAVGELSASTVLTGGKMDDFFSDCRLHPALSRFAKSSDFDGHSAECYTIDRSEKRPSVVKVGTANDGLYPSSPSHVHIEIEAENSHNSDVLRGSVSSASLSPIPSDDDENDSSSTPVHRGFFFQDDLEASRNSTSFEPSLANLFHGDGDILY